MLRGRKTPRLDLSLSSDLVDLDELIETSDGASGRLAPIGAASGPIESAGVCRCEGEVKVTAKTLKSHNADLSDLAILIKLGFDGAELTDGHIILPGTSKLSAHGKMPRPSPGRPVFDGAIGFESAEPRLLFTWLGVPTDRVKPGVLKSLALNGPFKLESRNNRAGAEHYLTPHLDGAALSLDGQAFTLSAAYDDRDPGYVLFALEGERLNADDYGIGLFWPAKALKTEAWKGTLWGRAARAAEVDVSLSLGSLKTAGHTARGLEAELSRKPGGPASARVSIGDLAGYQVLFAGERATPQQGRPADENARLVISGAGSPINLPFAGKPMAGALKLNLSLDQTGDRSEWHVDGSIGTIKLAGEATGIASEKLLPDIDRLNASAKFDRGIGIITGTFTQLTENPTFNGNVTVDAQDFPSFMRELGYSYNPRRKDLGALSLVAQLVASGDHVGVSALSASVGDDSMTAVADLNLIPERPVLSTDIKINKLSLEGYLAAPEKGTLWSGERLKLDIFRKFDGEIRFDAERFEIGPWDMRKAHAVFGFKDGKATTSGARAILYGGAMTFTGEAQLDEDGGKGSFDMNVQNFDWLRASPEFFPALGVDGKGNASAHVAGSARGNSLAALVSSFGARIEMNGTGGAVKGFNLAAWGNGLNGAKGPNGIANLAKTTLTQGTTTISTFRIQAAADKGVLSVTQGEVALMGGEGAISGKIHLLTRTLNLRLALKPAAEPDLPQAAIVGTGRSASRRGPSTCALCPKASARSNRLNQISDVITRLVRVIQTFRAGGILDGRDKPGHGRISID
ncbi:MAG: AsmA-like C-terminal region-containing protein [Alphaproteobacteria bacterium]